MVAARDVDPRLSVDYLANHPSALPRVARWLHRQWLGEWGYTRAQSIDELRGRLSRCQLPLALMAMIGERPTGVASLVELERPGSRTPVCCLAGVYVLPRSRRRGIGRLLCLRAVHEAERLQRPSIGLFTLGFESFYREMGWRKVTDAVPPSHGERQAAAYMELDVAALRTSRLSGPRPDAGEPGL